MYYLTVSLGQESGHGLAGPPAQGLQGARAGVLVCNYMGTGRTHFLATVELTEAVSSRPAGGCPSHCESLLTSGRPSAF